MNKILIVLITLGLSLSSAYAYKINAIQVIRYGERYLITFDAQLDLSVSDAIDVINDFENASKLSPAVKSTEVYHIDDTTARVTTVMRPCVYIICRTITKLSIVNLDENEIHLTGIAGAGSFRNVQEVIKLSPMDNGTNLRYKADISPKFFLPTWIGVRFIRSTVGKYLGGILENIELQAINDN